jgi:crotonobetainyl-CoA:carnitine CoA-transferase CaiB-like acyl-CoA transferase
MLAGGPLPEAVSPRHGSARNPLSGTYRTSDDRWIMLTMLQPGRYWPEFCQTIERPELITDPRFDTVDKLMTNAPQAAEIIAEVLRSRPFIEWIKVFDGMSGQWAAVQEAWEVSQDKSLRANGLISKLVDHEGHERELVTSPVQFDEIPQQLTRAPQFAEHTDEILAELGISVPDMLQLKVAGAVT